MTKIRNDQGPWARLRPGTVQRLMLASPLFVFLATAGAAYLALEMRGKWAEAWDVEIVLAAAVGATLAIAPMFRLAIRAALLQVDAVEKAAARVERGDMDARAPFPAPGDPDALRLTRVFNRLLDGLSEERRRLREIAARAFRAQEAERARLAGELQEQTAQTLSALLVTLRVARGTEDPGKRDELLDALRNGLCETADGLREYARFLHTPLLGELGPVAAVEAYARTLTASTGLPIEIDAAEVRGGLTAEGELALYRTVQEALSNAVRHAGAGRVRVRIGRVDHAVEAVVEDDGRGFDPAAAEARSPCLGLFGMKERALYAGGSAEVESAPGRGTRVVIRIPASLAPAAEPERPARPSIVPPAAVLLPL